MDYKLDYISRIFKKTSKKRIENYVLTRIWHRLDDLSIRICHQQYVNRGNGKYALTDLYFPQIKYHIEVNEEFHYKDEIKQDLDAVRAKDIEKITNGHIIRFIDCRKCLAEIHNQVDILIDEIHFLIEKQKEKGLFRSWEENELTPEYWKTIRTLKVADNINLRTIEDIGILFDVKIKSRGFLKPGAVKYLSNGFSEIWWPEKKKKNYWINDFHQDFKYITEENADPEKAKKHLSHFIQKDSECKRIVFFKYKDELGFNFYKFVGCYHFNIDKSLKENKVVWERFTEELTIKPELKLAQ